MFSKVRVLIAPIGGAAAAGVALVTQVVAAHASFDYTNTFAGVQTELTTALQAIVPEVVIVFAILLGLKLAFAFFRRNASK